MGWFTSIFAGDSSSYSKRGQALSSTHEAFSLPTSSPGHRHMNGGTFSPTPLNEPDSATSPSYTYPPPASPIYDYSPSPLTARPSSLLPLHNPPSTPGSYPPLDQTWNRLRNWLSREYPELGDTLNWGILPQDLAQVEMALGFDLPAVVRESYLLVDGQEPESAAGCSKGLFFGLTLLPLDDVLDEWRFWREVEEDPSTGANARLKESMRSIPPGWIRNEYTARGWIPLVADKAGNYLGIDMTPGQGGAPGQVIVFGRDYDTKVVMWRGDGPGGWAKWLAAFAEELESGEGFDLGTGDDESVGSEDDVGYESYFFDGAGPGGGGTESSATGLRLTGEYRGWSVLDAWADRSIRRWREQGTVQDDSVMTEIPDKRRTAYGLGVLNFDTGNSGAEVPIPVLGNEVKADETSVSTSALIPTDAAPRGDASTSPVPTVTVTKPPAPRPVDLPTEQDIGHFAQQAERDDDYSVNYQDGDLEAGLAMQEVDGEHPLSPAPAPISRAVKTKTNARSDPAVITPAEVPLPVSPANATPSVELVAPIVTPAPAPAVDDLLIDTTETTEAPDRTESTQPLFISSPPPSETSIPTLEEAAASGAENNADFLDDSEPEASIRLVGGGGSFGTAAEEPTPEEKEDVAEETVDEPTPSSSPDPLATNSAGARHQKKKSFGDGLKRLSHFGRRKEGSVDVKETE